MESRKSKHDFHPVAPGIILIIAAPIFYYILRYGVDVPYWDQWEYVGFFDHLSKGTLTLKELFSQQNEYRQLFPNIIFVCLGRFTNWNVRYEMMVIFGMAVIVSFNIFRLSELTFKGSKWKKYLLLILANLLIFSPAQFENWLFGVQIVYFVPIVCLTTGLLLCYSSIKKQWIFFYCIVLGSISTLSSANGFLYWMILFPVVFMPINKSNMINLWPKILIWIFAATITLILYLYNYHTPGNHPAIFELFHDPLKSFFYFFNLSGNPVGFGNNFQRSFWSGLFLVAGYILFIAYFIRQLRDNELNRQLKVWILLGSYSLLTGLLITLGRVGFGVGQSFSSRYLAFTLYLVISVIYMASIVFEHRKKSVHPAKIHNYLFWFLFIFLILVQIFKYPASVNNLKAYHNAIQHAKAGLLFIHYIDHSKCQRMIYPANFAELEKRAEILDSLGYLRPGLIKSKVIEEIEGTDHLDADFGAFSKLRVEPDSTFTVSGFATLPYRNEPADAILVTAKNGNRQSILIAFENSGNPDWKISIPIHDIPKIPSEINAWAFDANTGKAYRLKNSHVLAE